MTFSFSHRGKSGEREEKRTLISRGTTIKIEENGDSLLKTPPSTVEVIKNGGMFRVSTASLVARVLSHGKDKTCRWVLKGDSFTNLPLAILK